VRGSFRSAADLLQSLAASERAAIENAMAKLEALGPELRFPHCSSIRDADKIWELRPRAGQCAWRAFYGRFGHAFVWWPR
jgi:phage-related protein